ncbi:hypothetical protein N7478_011575 [Penicillium angulare]|uniref:uncharacterized protein n=1 Tax=Penicillium angulare TaxID=116970 RepID=UPI0025406FC5|nr:uncharacterized protein N7478_011575 [Penicillium angulare]KAJ5263970.1 hypothetical protein N7478_011575 [Penicillium angulare]
MAAVIMHGEYEKGTYTLMGDTDKRVPVRTEPQKEIKLVLTVNRRNLPKWILLEASKHKLRVHVQGIKPLDSVSTDADDDIAETEAYEVLDELAHGYDSSTEEYADEEGTTGYSTSWDF